MNGAGWRQLTVLHLTDLHFGDRHSFNPPITPDGTRAEARGRPTLAQSVLADAPAWRTPYQAMLEGEARERGGSSVGEVRTILALTGDLTERADTSQFDQAAACIDTLRAGLGITSQDVFIVPGNHDLSYAEVAPADRWARYCRFYEKQAKAAANAAGLPAPHFDPDTPQALTRVIDQSDIGLIVAEINSCSYVQRGQAGERRGEVDEQAIDQLDQQLSAIDAHARSHSIRLALIHHHPVVLPGLADPGEGYDAVVNANMLLGKLKRHAFHAILHGHKHLPHTFSYDAVCAWTRDAVRPLMVVAGGSAGSNELRREPGSTNTYNVIRIRWQPDAPQARIHVETRGHVTHDEEGLLLPAGQHHWNTLRIDDRLLSSTQPSSARIGWARLRDATDAPYEKERDIAILATRRNFPVIEVMPSLDPRQGYEAHVWIEAQLNKEGYLAPDRVEWSAGRYFPEVHTITRVQSPQFDARFSYYGPMLVQARIFWDGDANSPPYDARAYVFARFPGQRTVAAET